MNVTDIVAVLGAVTGIYSVIRSVRKSKAEALKLEAEAYTLMIKPLKEQIARQNKEIIKLKKRVLILENNLNETAEKAELLRKQIRELKEVPVA